MSKSIASPADEIDTAAIKLLNTTGKAFRLLRQDGLDVSSFLSRVVDEPDFREQVLVLAGIEPKDTVPAIAKQLNRANVSRFVDDLRVLAIGRPQNTHLPHSLDKETVLQGAKASSIEHFLDPTRLANALEPLTKRRQAIIIRYYGFGTGGLGETKASIGSDLGVSYAGIADHLKQAFYRLRKDEERRIIRGALAKLPAVEPKISSDPSLPIEDLDLTERACNCLKRAGIDTIASLLMQDLGDLFSIPYFSQGCHDNITAKLAERGLALKDS